MAFNLPAMARQKGVRRQSVTLRPITPTQAQADALAAIYAPAWQVWRDHKPDILASYTPTPLADGDTLVRDTASETAAAIERGQADFLTRLALDITPKLRAWILRAESLHRERWIAAVNAGLGIDLSFLLTAFEVQETLETFLARNVALVKDISAQAQARISDAVFRGYQERRPYRDVAKEIDEAVGLGRKRAVRVAADQSSKLSAALDTERQVEAGLVKFKWRHSGKLHPRSWHKARNGKIYFIKTGKRVDGGETIPADDRAGRPPWCGCREQAYIDLMAELDI